MRKSGRTVASLVVSAVVVAFCVYGFYYIIFHEDEIERYLDPDKRISFVDLSRSLQEAGVVPPEVRTNLREVVAQRVAGLFSEEVPETQEPQYQAHHVPPGGVDTTVYTIVQKVVTRAPSGATPESIAEDIITELRQVEKFADAETATLVEAAQEVLQSLGLLPEKLQALSTALENVARQK